MEADAQDGDGNGRSWSSQDPAKKSLHFLIAGFARRAVCQTSFNGSLTMLVILTVSHP